MCLVHVDTYWNHLGLFRSYMVPLQHSWTLCQLCSFLERTSILSLTHLPLIHQVFYSSMARWSLQDMVCRHSFVGSSHLLRILRLLNTNRLRLAMDCSSSKRRIQCIRYRFISKCDGHRTDANYACCLPSSGIDILRTDTSILHQT